MAKYSKDFYRSRAIARRRDPEQDARNVAASEAIRAKVASHLAASPLIQRLNAAVAAAASSGIG
jgi:hypothetical protein